MKYSSSQILLFGCAREEELRRLSREGHADGIMLWKTLNAARAACDGVLLVVNPAALDNGCWEEIAGAGKNGRVCVAQIPPAAFCNLTPYRPPRPVAAGGGYVVRRAPAGRLELLLIFRRGIWDLPKGKQDPGETVEACALREVREEVGIQQLRREAPLGTTVHGYTEGDVYRVKTTHWFLMTTPAAAFTPQAEEDIERVEWVAWPDACRRLGHGTLRRHMRSLDLPGIEERL